MLQSSRATILVVDPQASTRSGIELLLSHRYRVVVAATGVEALRTRDRIDVLITEVVLSGMPAATLVTVLRARFPGVRIIFTSTYAQDSRLVSEALKTAQSAFQPKPIDIDHLAKLIDQALEES